MLFSTYQTRFKYSCNLAVNTTKKPLGVFSAFYGFVINISLYTYTVNFQPDLGDHPRDLPSLLHQLGLSKYLKVFEEQDVDLQVFLSLTDNDLKEIGIK